ncbi:MAG: methyl-accepting chemotaxis protein [Bacillota bacterium]
MSRFTKRATTNQESATGRLRRFRFSLGLKLGLGLGILVLNMVLMAWVGSNGLSRVGQDFAQAMLDQSSAVQLSGEVALRAQERISALRGYVLTGNLQDFEEVAAAASAFETAVAALEPVVKGDITATNTLESLKNNGNRLTGLESEVRMARQQNSLEYAATLLSGGEEIVRQVKLEAGTIFTLVSIVTDQRAQAIQAEARRISMITLGVNGAAIFGALIFAVIFTRRLIRPVRLVAQAAERLAAGNLSAVEIPVTSTDELGDMARSVSAALQNLRQAMSAVTEAAEQVAEASEQLSQTSNGAAQAAGEMSQSVSMVAASSQSATQSAAAAREAMDQLQQAIAQIASGAQEQARGVQESAEGAGRVMQEMEEVESRSRAVAAASQRTASAADQGSRVVSQAVAAMRELQQAVQETTVQVKGLGEASNRIGEITQAITEIADQTNLLALNAAIEAARAGDAGRGFAVVAEEVRKLSERSAKSALEIGQIIDSIQQGTRRAVQSMDAGNTQVASTVGLAESAGQSLRQIQEAVGETDREIQAITLAVQRVTESSRRMVEAMNAVAAVTEENTASTEEMAAGAEQVVAVFGEMMAAAEQASEMTKASASVVEQMSASTEEIAASAAELAETATRLKATMGRFKL